MIGPLAKSEVAEVSTFVIESLKDRGLEVTEGERALLIGKATKHWRTDGWEMMTHQIKWELDLITRSRTVKRVMDFYYGAYLPNQPRVVAYLDGIGLKLYRDGKQYYTLYPRGIDVVNTRKRILDIIKNG